MFPLELIHPLVVHFPIVFFLTLAAVDLVAVMRGVPLTGRGFAANVSASLAVLAGLSAAVAFVFGTLALDIAVQKGAAEASLETHEALGTWTATLLGIWAVLRAFVWWRDLAITGKRRTALVVIELAGALLIIATAYFGGQLVYDLGVNVAVAAAG